MSHSVGMKARNLAGIFVALCLALAVPLPGMAQVPPPIDSILPGGPGYTPPSAPGTPGTPGASGGESDVCTNFAGAMKRMDEQCAAGASCTEGGLLSEIYLYIKEVVGEATQRLFVAFTSSYAYQSAVGAAMVLMVVFFGAAFTMGVVQASYGQVLIRLVKLGVVFSLIGPFGWQFFNEYMVAFFTDGVDDLVKGVNTIGTGIEAPPGATPFFQFDRLAEFIIQPDTLVAIMGSFFQHGPFGALMGSLLAIAVYGFLSMLVTALRTYAVSYVARTLLLGLAPVFFVFLLFEKTKQLFMSWLNALITLSLQPILLFTFLAFFFVLVESASRDMLNTELCWTDCKIAEGVTNPTKCWKFVDKDTGKPYNSEFTWQGPLECLVGGKSDKCESFPVNILDVLSFLILVYLCTRFVESITRIANELGGAFISLDAGGRFDQFMREQARTGGPLSVNKSDGNKPK